MAVLVDTSVLVRSADSNDPDYLLAIQSQLTLRNQGEDLVLARQVLYEYWAVATRPTSSNGLGFSTVDARQDIEDFKQRYTIPADPEALLDTWLTLVAGGQVAGKPSHDARLVALMVSLKIPTVLTFNTNHFARFPQVIALHPNDA